MQSEKRHTELVFPKVEIKEYNIVIDGCKLFGQLAKNDIRIFDNIRKIAVDQRDAYTAGCLLDYTSFKENYKSILIDPSNQQPLIAKPKAIKQLTFTRNLELCWECKNCLYYGIIQGSYLRFLTRTSESILKRSYESYLLFYFAMNTK